MRWLNFGCGRQFSDSAEWENIDFISPCAKVKHVDLCHMWPYKDNTFDFAYSSHVLEHFSPDEALFVLKEANRVLKPGGILRTVVPDLEKSAREYIRTLDANTGTAFEELQHEWVVIEMIDQMVRETNGGQMATFMEMAKEKPALYAYVHGRIGQMVGAQIKSQITMQKLVRRLTQTWGQAVSTLLPPAMRKAALCASLDRHKWMYDRRSLSRIMSHAGFVSFTTRTCGDSEMPGFVTCGLDVLPSGSPYKGTTAIFCEAQKINDPNGFGLRSEVRGLCK